jgi:FkbM family methyltransferase
MIKLIKDVCKPVYHFMANENYREYYRLFSKYSKKPRLYRDQVSFLNYSLEVPDVLSFIHQYKEIFIDKSYAFKSDVADPLILDCGANVGLSCLYFKKLYSQCRIKAFEADPAVYKFLKSNLISNLKGGDEVEIFNKAVWTDNKGVEFHTDGADGGTVMGKKSDNKIRIDSIRLKDLLSEQPVDFLKMDIEGAETDVLLDCDQEIQNAKNIFFEYHSFIGRDQRFDEILRMLKTNGFRYFIQSPYIVQEPFLRETVDAMDLQLNVYCTR